MTPTIYRNQGVCILRNLEGNSLVFGKVAFDHLPQQPVQVGLGSKLHTGLATKTAMVAHHTRHMDFAKLIGKYSDRGADLL
jgi:hypothetical protein